ncbi:hypothetical protein LTS17_004653 [Exophiala oligosperma]
MSKEEAVKEGFATPTLLSDWHTLVAREYSRQTVDVPSVRSIQGNLILALKELLTRTSYKAWIFTGIAVRQAQALRLGREYHNRLSPRQKEVQRRTYWACFVMDRLVAYCCWRPQMIGLDCVSLNLPCPETIFTFEESFDAPTLDTLSFPCEVSRLGLLPYYIAIVNLWSQATYIQVKGGRRYNKHQFDSSTYPFSPLEKEINDIHDSLPATVRWSTQNRKLFRHTGQEALFVTFHLVLNHARCALREEYLPYEDEMDSPLHEGGQYDRYDGTHPSADKQDERTTSICISSSEAILDVMETFLTNDGGFPTLQSLFAAPAFLSAANTQLWLQYVVAQDEEACRKAAASVDKITAVLELWTTHWPVADAWLSTLATLRRLYQATYCPVISPESSRQGVIVEAGAPIPPILDESDIHDIPYPNLTEGNGLPLLNGHMSDKIRFVLLAWLEDAEARDRVVNSSMSTLGPHLWEYEGFPEDLDFPLPDFYGNDPWSGLIGDAAVGTDTIQGLGLGQHVPRD